MTGHLLSKDVLVTQGNYTIITYAGEPPGVLKEVRWHLIRV